MLDPNRPSKGWKMAVNIWKSYVCIAVEETNIESILVFVLLTESLVHNNVNCLSSFLTYTARKGRGTYVIRWAIPTRIDFRGEGYQKVFIRNLFYHLCSTFFCFVSIAFSTTSSKQLWNVFLVSASALRGSIKADVNSPIDFSSCSISSPSGFAPFANSRNALLTYV